MGVKEVLNASRKSTVFPAFVACSLGHMQRVFTLPSLDKCSAGSTIFSNTPDWSPRLTRPDVLDKSIELKMARFANESCCDFEIFITSI